VVDTPEADKVSPAPNKDTSDVSDDVAASSEESEASNIMPDIPLTLINGEETTFWQLAEMGKPVVINSFASWCPPCKKEMPDFTGYLKQALSGGVEMKAVRTAVIKFTDVRMDEPAGGTRSFKDIYLHLAELFGEF